MNDKGSAEHTLKLDPAWRKTGHSVLVQGVMVDYNGREQRAARRIPIGQEIEAPEERELEVVLSGRAILNMQRLVLSVGVSDYVIKYVARLVRATRPGDPTAPDYIREMVDWGAGPRAGQYLVLGGKAMAAMDGRFSVSLDDVRSIAIPVLRHRIGTNFQAQVEGTDSVKLVERLLKDVPEPEIPKFETSPT